MADRTNDILDQTPIKNISASEAHPLQAHVPTNEERELWRTQDPYRWESEKLGSHANWGKFEQEARPSTNIEDARQHPIGLGYGGGAEPPAYLLQNPREWKDNVTQEELDSVKLKQPKDAPVGKTLGAPPPGIFIPDRSPQADAKPHASPNPAQPAGREAMTGGPRSMVRPQGPTLARSDMSEGASRAHDESRVEPKPQDTKSTSGGNQTATGSSEGGGGPMGHAPYPEGHEYAGKVRQIESGGDDKNVTGPNVGRYQFSKDQFKKLDIDPKHPMDPEQQDKGLYNQNSQIAQAWRETHGGENPTPAQMYQMHQQGIAGTAALHDPKNKDRPADEVVAEAMGYDKAKAKKAIMAQTGSKDIVSGGMPTSGQFAEHWNKLYKDAKDSDAKVKENQDKVHKFMHQNLFRGDTKKKEEKSGGEPKSNPQGSTDKSEDKSTTDKDKYKRLSDAKTLSKGKVMPGPNPANPYQNTSEFEYAVVTDSGAGDPTKQQRVQISPSSLAGVDPTSMPYAKTHVAHSQEAPTWNSPHSHKNGNIVKVRLDKQSGEWEIHGSPGTINT